MTVYAWLLLGAWKKSNEEWWCVGMGFEYRDEAVLVVVSSIGLCGSVCVSCGRHGRRAEHTTKRLLRLFDDVLSDLPGSPLFLFHTTMQSKAVLCLFLMLV